MDTSIVTVNEDEGVRFPRIKRLGFTFVEIILAITVMAIAFMPILNLFTTAVEQINLTNELSAALNLGREGMEMVRNLNLPVERLELQQESYYPPYKEPPLVVNNIEFRIHTVIHAGTRPLQVDVRVFREGADEPILELTTLFEDLF